MVHVEGVYPKPVWPTLAPSSSVSNTLLFQWLFFLLVTLAIITLAIECFCVPLCFCEDYRLYSVKWYPRYYSQRYVPIIYTANLRPLQLNAISGIAGKSSSPHQSAPVTSTVNSTSAPSSGKAKQEESCPDRGEKESEKEGPGPLIT